MSTTDLKLHWTAQFNNGEQLHQFDAGGEHLFKEVIDKQNYLKYFALYYIEKDIKFTLDLKLGIIYINKQQIPEAELLPNVNRKNRLIYFRRVKHEIGSSGQIFNTSIIYFLGYQWTDNAGNHKKIIQIDGEGNIII